MAQCRVHNRLYKIHQKRHLTQEVTFSCQGNESQEQAIYGATEASGLRIKSRDERLQATPL